MATPTDQQQIRATLRRAARNVGPNEAVRMTLVSAMDVIGTGTVRDVVGSVWPEPSSMLPPLMGTAEVAEAFGIANSNISKLSDRFRPEPVARISGGKVPVYLASDVMAKAEARRAARGDGDA